MSRGLILRGGVEVDGARSFCMIEGVAAYGGRSCWLVMLEEVREREGLASSVEDSSSSPS